MRFGLAPCEMGMSGDARTIADLASLAEEAGWDGFFLEDYVIHHDPLHAVIYDPWIALAAIAMRTTRIRIGPIVTPVARRRPWKLARETVTLDHLSNGRLILGVGLGDTGDLGFALVGEPTHPIQRAELLDEGLEVLAGLWSGKPFRYDGKHYHVDGVTFLPTPLQKPRIPIWVGGFWPTEGPIRRAARWDGICPAGDDLTPADVRVLDRLVRDRRRSPDPFDIVIGGHTAGLEAGQARSKCLAFAEAGATWWLEFVHPVGGDFEAIRRRIGQGPPRID
jgi:alkanesulfonate monooxygenase SsuD/methylene tetrahydromethanopterin reductase-like flavin-dependent oxidoreductase (luciferase family)